MYDESEAVALLNSDVTLEFMGGAWCLLVKVQMSKTDQERAGHSILVSPSPLRLTCPLFWYSVYDRMRAKILLPLSAESTTQCDGVYPS